MRFIDLYFFFFDIMEEYCFINDLFDEVLLNFKSFIKRKLITPNRHNRNVSF